MKGIVFNLLQEVVVAEHGEDAWDALLERAGLDGAFTSLGSYPDEHLGRLVAAASGMLGLPARDVVRWFGRRALPRLAALYPDLFRQAGSTRKLLLSLNDIIHPEVRKLYPGADVPTFEFLPPAADGLVMRYRSTRRLCAFAEGLIEGAGEHFSEAVSVRQPLCMERGDAFCEIHVALPEAAAGR